MALTKEEVHKLSGVIYKGVHVLSSGIAQLYLGSPNPNVTDDEVTDEIVRALRDYGADKWKFTDIQGALLFSKSPAGVFKFTIYDLETCQVKFEYELYENLTYHKLSDHLHAFEMENCVCGFLFSDTTRAAKFMYKVQKNLPSIKSTGQAVNGQSIPKEKARKEKKEDENKMLIDPDNIPPEWHEILESAGIKQEDLHNVAMQKTIQQVLLQFGISLDGVQAGLEKADMEQAGWTPEEQKEYEIYQENLRQYETELARYNEELALYEEKEKQLVREQELYRQIEARKSAMPEMSNEWEPALPARPPQEPPRPPTIDQSEMDAPPLPMRPVVNMAKPIAPALPPVNIDHLTEAQAKAVDMVNERSSKMVIKANFLNELKLKGKGTLRPKPKELENSRLSTLPQLSKVGAVQKQGIMGALMEQMQKQRIAVADNQSEAGSGAGHVSWLH